MKTIFFAMITVLGTFTAAAAPVSNYDFDFSAFTKNTNLGSYRNSFVSAPSGYTIQAYGFENGSANDLYEKHQGSSDNGLGLAFQGSQEIDSHGLLILDISGLNSPQSLGLELSSIDGGEKFAVYGLTSQAYSGGTTAPKLTGNPLFTGGSLLDDKYFSVPAYSNYQYLAITARSGNVLLEGVTANLAGVSALSTPEPATMGFVGLALIAFALGGRLVRQNRG
jgi:hypothetical protein